MKKDFLIMSLLFLLIGCSTIQEKSNIQINKRKISSNSEWITNQYENKFSLYNIASEIETKEKISKAYNQLFFGDYQNERIFFTLKDDNTMGYILDPSKNIITSEGISYGMIISLMMNDKSTFDKLWKFAKLKMQNTSKEDKYYFSWLLSGNYPYKVLDSNSAPDGEEYIATALILAKNRWGNGEGIFNYESEVNLILNEMLNKKSYTQVPIFHPDYKQVVFTSDAQSEVFTNPSYHTPAFYELWSIYSKFTEFSDIAEISRDFLFKASNSSTGLYSDYATFNGKPKYFNNGQYSSYDSYRVILNLALDYKWFGKDEKEAEIIKKILNFYNTQPYPYYAVYTVDGKSVEKYTSEALIAANAIGASVLNDDLSKKFILSLWNQGIPTGQWRYYNGLMHLMALIHVSGNYKILKE